MQQGDGLLFLLYDTLNTLLDRNIESDGFDDWPVTVYLFIGEHIALVVQVFNGDDANAKLTVQVEQGLAKAINPDG